MKTGQFLTALADTAIMMEIYNKTTTARKKTQNTLIPFQNAQRKRLYTLCSSTDKTDTMTHGRHMCSSQHLSSVSLSSLCFAFVENVMSAWINPFQGSVNDTPMLLPYLQSLLLHHLSSFPPKMCIKAFVTLCP